MSSKKRILLKLTGEIFLNKERHLTASLASNIVAQIKQLNETHQFGIVIGGGNFFRGSQHGTQMGIRNSVAHQIGMLGTMMNGLMLKDLIEQQELPAELFCAMPSPEVGIAISPQTINECLHDGCTLIFTGGTGNPFFTTDTTAVLRGLQINADEIWKGTSIDGAYDKDPKKHADARRFTQLSFRQALQDKIGVMDLTAYAMAETYRQRIRIFDIFSQNALLQAAQNKEFGSLIS